jgi:L-rhamnose mutarotase
MKVREAFLMRVKPGCEEEYRKRHDGLWQDLMHELNAAGVADYSIFLDRTSGFLFAVRRIGDRGPVEALSLSPVMRKWWEYMADLMETNADKSPVVWPLEEVFHMD